MSKYIFKQIEIGDSTLADDTSLDINEFFVDSIQGEGATMGSPASFLRMQGCTLNCTWCDTKWKMGGRYSFGEIFNRMEQEDLIYKFSDGQRLILTGGSPLKQQDRLIQFFIEFERVYQFRPIIEIENECTLIPRVGMIALVDVWNNSPKLANSAMKRNTRFREPVLLFNHEFLHNSWYKFVVDCEEDWEEIQMDFIDTGFVRKDQIILMPLAGNLHQLEQNEKMVLTMAIKYGVRYSTRQQLILGLP